MNLKYLILIMVLSVFLAGCIGSQSSISNTSQQTNQSNEKVIVKSFENRDPMLTKEEFPDFKLLSQQYLITYKNLSSTLDSETVHGAIVINSTDKIPEGFRVYGDSEAYNSGQRFILIQYKVFDSNSRLNDTIDLTVGQYIRNGFITKILKNNSFSNNRKIYVLENGAPNTNVTINKNMNVTLIIFGFDNVIGKIGVEDTKDKSLNEALKILNIVFDKLKIKTEEVEAQKIQASSDSKHNIT